MGYAEARMLFEAQASRSCARRAAASIFGSRKIKDLSP